MINCSKFHRGKIRIRYEPFQAAVEDEYNITRSEVIDISETVDHKFEVGWGSSQNYLEVAKKDTGVPYYIGDTNDPTAHNGAMIISIANDLTVPDDLTADTIEILIFACAGEDMEFAVPTEFVTEKCNILTGFDPAIIVPPNQPPAAFRTQSGVVGSVDEDLPGQNVPEAPVEETLVEKQSTYGLDQSIFVGENISSIRTIMKRYTHVMQHAAIGALPEQLTFSTFPIHNYAGSVVTARETPLLHRLQVMYFGRRGSVRWKSISQSTTGQIRPASINLTYLNDATPALTSGLLPPVGWGGMDVTTIGLNNALEWEAPYYSNYRFTNSRAIVDAEPYSQIFTWSPSEAGHTTDFYSAAGDDLQLFNFGCVPRLLFNIV